MKNYFKFFIIIFGLIFLFNCSKKDPVQNSGLSENDLEISTLKNTDTDILNLSSRDVNVENIGYNKAIAYLTSYYNEYDINNPNSDDYGTIKFQKDIEDMKQLLTERDWEVHEDYINEDEADFEEEFINAANELEAGDYFLFYYSGHGIQLLDDNGDEEDSEDEVLALRRKYYDMDHPDGLLIKDDRINELLNMFDPGVRIVMIIDCCHSETMYQLPKRDGDINTIEYNPDFNIIDETNIIPELIYIAAVEDQYMALREGLSDYIFEYIDKDYYSDYKYLITAINDQEDQDFIYKTSKSASTDFKRIEPFTHPTVSNDDEEEEPVECSFYISPKPVVTGLGYMIITLDNYRTNVKVEMYNFLDKRVAYWGDYGLNYKRCKLLLNNGLKDNLVSGPYMIKVFSNGNFIDQMPILVIQAEIVEIIKKENLKLYDLEIIGEVYEKDDLASIGNQGIFHREDYKTKISWKVNVPLPIDWSNTEFEIYRSFDGNNFNLIANVGQDKSIGTINSETIINYTDENIIQGYPNLQGSYIYYKIRTKYNKIYSYFKNIKILVE